MKKVLMMKIKFVKTATVFATLLVGSLSFAQGLPEFTGAGAPSMFAGQGMVAPPMGAQPGTFVSPQRMVMGEQPAYAQVGAQGCDPRGYVGPVTGPIQSNGMPMPLQMVPGH